MWDFFSDEQRQGSNSAVERGSDVVRPLEPPQCPPTTIFEVRVVALLKKEGVISFDNLVRRMAADLYVEQRQNGAWMADIGLFGSRLFNREVIRELEGADGIPWNIEQKKHDL